MVPVLGQLAEFEVVGDAVHAPRLGHRLERADQELAGVLLDVDAAVRIAQHRQVRRHLGHRLGQHVEVLAGVQRHAHPGHAPDRAAPHAGAVDHHLGADRAELGLDAGHPAVRLGDAGDPAALDDPGAVLARALGQRLGDVDRVGLAVGRDVDGAGEVADLDQRVQLLASPGVSSWTSRPQARPIAAWRLSSVRRPWCARDRCCRSA